MQMREDDVVVAIARFSEQDLDAKQQSDEAEKE
jgi:hypothetical protein